MKLVRDNLIKVHHQQTVDHQVISGSDHGVRKWLQRNLVASYLVRQGRGR
ncbi:MAG: hypothetical protein LBF34_02350 [Puniceicoccales bacterium]|nr:hypothetical protein [Puniceicoccales bacterium]